jgi:hypothetical protein
VEQTFVGNIRRIDFEPKKDFLGFRTYAHVFLKDRQNGQVDAYTDDPRLEAALLAAYAPAAMMPPTVEVHYEDVGDAKNGVKRITRVVLDREFSKP